MFEPDRSSQAGSACAFADDDSFDLFDPDNDGPQFDDDADTEAPLDAVDGSVGAGLPTRDLLGQLLAIPPCLPVLGALLAVDRSALAPDEAITFVQVLARQVALMAAVEAEATVAAVSGHPMTQELQVLGDAAFNAMLDRHEYRARQPETDGERLIRIHDAVREEYALALRISQQQAHARIEASRLLVGPLARTLAALADGAISPRHATVVAEAAARLPGADAITSLVISDAERTELAGVHEQACTILQDRVLPTACRATVPVTRQRANRAVLAIDPAGQERRRRLARCTRDVWVAHEQDGHSLLMARMGTARALACLTAIDSAATDPGLDADGRLDCDATLGERRTAALDRMILSGLALPGPNAMGGPTAPGRRDPVGAADPSPRVRVHVDVTIPLDTLLGLSQAPGQLATGSGRGPRIDATIDEIRDLLADPHTDTTLRRLITDPMTGHLLDIGRDRYQAPTRLRDFITTRDRTCRFPGCQRRATLCQLDHALAWDNGGETTRANLGALCTRHHQLKTHAHWQITGSAADGSCTWTSPDGRHYAIPPRHVLDPPADAGARSTSPGAATPARDPDPPPF